MILAGDEISRSQGGNNNAYCQDNQISWIDWAKMDKSLLKFTQELIHLRKNHPIFCRRRWFQGQPIKGSKVEDIAWFLPDASEMSEDHWNTDFAKSLGVYLNGLGIHLVDPKGERIIDDHFYIIFNAHFEPLIYKLPPANYGNQWTQILDTGDYEVKDKETYNAGDELTAQGRSVIILHSPVK
jgi:isoamylase